MYLLLFSVGYLIGFGIYFKLKRNSKLNKLAHFETESSLIKSKIDLLEQKLMCCYNNKDNQVYNELSALKNKKKWIEEQIVLVKRQWPYRFYLEWDTGSVLAIAIISAFVLFCTHTHYLTVNSMLEEQKYLESITYDNIIDNGLIEINEGIRDWNSKLMRNRNLESTWFFGQFMPKIYLEEDGYGFHLIEYKVKD